MILYTGTLRGQSHAECEDAVAYASDRGVCAIALADGASCCEASRLFAEDIVQWAADISVRSFARMQHMTDMEIARDMLALIRERQHVLSRTHHIGIQELGSTLKVFITNGKQHIILSLGDGAVFGMDGCSSLTALTNTAAEPGQLAHATWLTIHDDAVILEKLQVVRGKALTGYVLTSDGLDGTLYNAQGECSESFAEVLHDLRDDPLGAGTDFMNAIASQLPHEDDVSLGLLLLDVPGVRFLARTDPRNTGSSASARAALRRAAANRRYLKARSEGLSPRAAARRAGWAHSGEQRRRIQWLEAYCQRMKPRLGLIAA